MATEILNVTFDGSTSVPRLPGSGDVPWSGGTPSNMGYYSVFHDVAGDDLDATATLTGDHWRIKTLRIAGEDHHTTIADADNGVDRRIDFLELGYNSDVDLISTRVRYIFGWDGDRHEVTLGSEQVGSTYSINLYATRNILTTGNAFVHQIDTGGSGSGKGDTITIGSGGAQAVNTYTRNDTITTTTKNVQFIWTDAGHDTVTIGSGGASSVRTHTGNDTVTTTSEFVEMISTGTGRDTVIVGAGGAETIKTGSGNDTITTADGYVTTINTGQGHDTLDLGDGGAEAVKAGDGNDTITTTDGYVTTINGGNGHDTLDLGGGGAGFIRMGDGNDVIKLEEIDPAHGVVIQGGDGTDRVEFLKFSSGVTVSLDGAAEFQNIGAPAGDPTAPASGYFSLLHIENAYGSNFADIISGDESANTIRGYGGHDELVGGGGHDMLRGDGGADRLFGQQGRDSLFGGGGGDLIDGGPGGDTLRGDAGADIFVFGNASGTDSVMDFADGTDILRLVGHTGGFDDLSFSDSGGDREIVHDNGTIILVGEAGLVLTQADFDFVMA